MIADVREDKMTIAKIKLKVERLRSVNIFGKLPASDVALLRKKANRCELESLLVVPLFFVCQIIGIPKRPWEHLFIAVTLGINFVACRLQLDWYRKALLIFEEQGTQMVAELKQRQNAPEPSDAPPASFGQVGGLGQVAVGDR